MLKFENNQKFKLYFLKILFTQKIMSGTLRFLVQPFFSYSFVAVTKMNPFTIIVSMKPIIQNNLTDL